MKTAVSIPDDVYAGAERLAQTRGQTRSGLYAEALRDYLARHDSDLITGALDRLYGAVDSRADPALAVAAERLLRQVEW